MYYSLAYYPYFLKLHVLRISEVLHYILLLDSQNEEHRKLKRNARKNITLSEDLLTYNPALKL